MASMPQDSQLRELYELRNTVDELIEEGLVKHWSVREGLGCPTDADPVRMANALDAVCEVLDNYLFTIKAAREKHTVMMDLGRALRHRVLGDGVKEAVAVLSRAIPMERMVLVYVAEE